MLSRLLFCCSVNGVSKETRINEYMLLTTNQEADYISIAIVSCGVGHATQVYGTRLWELGCNLWTYKQRVAETKQ